MRCGDGVFADSDFRYHWHFRRGVMSFLRRRVPWPDYVGDGNEIQAGRSMWFARYALGARRRCARYARL